MLITGNNSANTSRTVIVGGDTSFYPGTWVDTITMKTQTPQTVRLGLAPGADDVLIDSDIAISNDFSPHRSFDRTDVIFITGVIAPIKLIIRK